MKPFLKTSLVLIILLGIFTVWKPAKLQAQTTLATGDLVFTSYNAVAVASSSIPDTFSFVLLVPVSAGTQIYFTDRGYFSSLGAWQAANGNTEGALLWTSGSAQPAGTEVTIHGLSATIAGVPNGSISGNTAHPVVGLSLNPTGDQIIAFQGGGGDPAAGTRIVGIHWALCPGGTTDAAWDATSCTGPTNPSQSQMPPSLTGGTTAFWSGDPGGGLTYTQGKFNCAGTPFSNAAGVRTAVMNKSNWVFATSTSTTSINIPPGCLYISACPPAAVTANPPNRTVCENGTTTFPITATGAGLTYQWQVDQGLGFGNVPASAPYSGTTTNTLTITGATAAMSGYLYRCVVTGTCGNATSTAGTLTVAAINMSVFSSTNATCFGGNNGSASITPSGGFLPYSFSWSPSGGTGNVASGLTAGTYTVTVTNNITCTATRTYTIGQGPAINVTTTTSNNVSCFGGNNGAATISATGGTGTLGYSWAPSGGTGTSISGRTSGVYTVTVTDGVGCTKTHTVNITQPAAALSTTAGTVNNVSCFGGSNGTATVVPAGGTPTYSYSWAPSGGTGATASGLGAGTYTVTVTDFNSCTTTRTFNITQPAAALSSTAGTVNNVSCFGGSNGTATVVAAGGTPTYSYSWAPSGGTGATASGLGAGTYTVTVTDFNSCTTTRTFNITQPASALSTTAGTVNNVSCFGGSNGTATVVAAGGTPTYSYSWAPSGGTGATASGLGAGTYTVTVTDFNSCTATRTFNITQPAAALSTTAGTVNNVSCFGGSNGTATVVPAGGTPTYSYSWAPSGGTGATASGLGTGTYTVTVTDFNSCTTSRTFNITQPAAALSSTAGTVNNVSCFGGANGSATVVAAGGTPTYSYSWAPSGGTGATASGLTAGTYTVTITDFNSCTATRTFNITQPAAALSTTAGTVNTVSCFGGSNGSATVIAAGGTPTYSYSWAPSGGTGATASGLTAGVYTVTVTDFNTCTTTRTFNITQPSAALSTTAGTVNTVSCFGGSNGSATVIAAGGTPTYSYSWAPSGGTGATASGLAAGVYTVTVTDFNTCTTTRTFNITQPAAALSTTAGTVNNVSCFGASTGSATVNVSGGTPTYSYSWAPSGGTGATASGLAAGTYTVTVTDFRSCTTTRTFSITQPPSGISTSAGTVNNVSCFGGSNGSATVIASGGFGTLHYSWAPSGGTAATASGLTQGTYTVTVTDDNTCTATRSFNITQPTALATSSGTTNNVSCNGGSNGSATVIASGGTPGPGYLYSWAPSGGTAATASGLAQGTYTVTVTDANSCTTSRTFTITQPSVITTSAGTVNNVSCNGLSDGSATVIASGGTGVLHYSWAPSGGTAATANSLVAGTYTVTVTDDNSCTKTHTFSITEPPAFTVGYTVSPNDTVCFNEMVTFTGTGAVSYTWSGGITNATPFAATATTTYTVTGTDASSCTKTATAILTVNALPAVGFTITPEDTVCTGTNVTLSGTGADTYTWTGGIDDATPFEITTSDIYTVTGTDLNGCSNTASSAITVNALPVVGSTSSTAIPVCEGTDVTLSGTGADSYSWTGGITDNVAFPATATTTYTVTGTDVNGCTNTNTNTVSVNPLPIVGYTASPNDTICIGEDVTLNGTGASSYVWTGTIVDGVPFSINSTNTFTVTGTDANNCSNTASATVVVISYPVVDLGPDVVQANPPAVLDAGAGFDSYLWAPGGETTQTISVTVNGTYIVTVSNYTCADSDTVQVFFTASIPGENGQQAELSLYPNPSNGVFNLSIENLETDRLVIEIMDMTGRTVYSQNAGSVNNKTIVPVNVAELSMGTYVLRVQANGRSTHLNFIVNK